MKEDFAPWRNRLHEIIFEADTKLGKLFDICLLILIVTSVILVMLESVEEINNIYGVLFKILEWIITVFFTIEYFLRIIAVYQPRKYIFSFYGTIDLLSILPSYIGLFLGVNSCLSTIRILRLIRIFRIFKLTPFLKASDTLLIALKASQAKIIVFLTFILNLVVIIGAVMYFIEGCEDSGFTSIPRSIYWAVVTLTTVGYGDIAPVTPLGQFFAALVMIMGYGVIAVPTGIVSAEIATANKASTPTTQTCKACMKEGHDADAQFCKFCGEKL